MIKTFLTASLLLTCLPAMATPISSPFYQPTMGHFLSKTSASYTKNKIKTTPTTRSYHRSLGEEVTLGLGSGFAALIAGDLNWTRQKQEISFSTPHASAYGAGLQGQWNLGGILTNLSVLYHQSTNVNFEARRKIKTNLYLGKELDKMTPYLHLTGNFPLNARAEFNDPLYRGETGVFQSVNDKMTLDTALYLQYDKNAKERSYGIRGEWSYLPTNWIAISLNGEWQARGKSHKRKTYHQLLGTKITFSF